MKPKESIIPLVKWLCGRRIKCTKRKGGRILVKRVAERLGDPPEWIAVQPAHYLSRLVVQYLPSGVPIPERVHEVNDFSANPSGEPEKANQ